MFLVPAERGLTPEMIHWIGYSKDHPMCRQVLDCHLAVLKGPQTPSIRAKYTRAIDEFILFWNGDDQKQIREEQRARGQILNFEGFKFA